MHYFVCNSQKIHLCYIWLLIFHLWLYHILNISKPQTNCVCLNSNISNDNWEICNKDGRGCHVSSLMLRFYTRLVELTYCNSRRQCSWFVWSSEITCTTVHKYIFKEFWLNGVWLINNNDNNKTCNAHISTLLGVQGFVKTKKQNKNKTKKNRHNKISPWKPVTSVISQEIVLKIMLVLNWMLDSV